jgi:GntR family transcriptional regulator
MTEPRPKRTTIVDGRRRPVIQAGPRTRPVQVPHLSAVDLARHLILERLNKGELGDGGRLPPERELAQQLQTSRTTLRQALNAIERSGMLLRVPGRGGGTFLTSRKVERDLSQIAGVPDYLRRQGFVAGTRVIGTASLPADDPTALALQLQPGAFVYEIVRIRLADGEPISLEHARFPMERFPNLLELPLGGSLYEVLELNFGVRVRHTEERIEVTLASRTEAQILGIEANAPLLSVDRVAYSNGDVPVESSRDLFRGDRTSISVRTANPPERGTVG